MRKNIFSLLCCPVCRGELSRSGGSLVCPQGHTFDVARCGYVNLLPPGKEKNSRTGDEKSMIRARADFLSCGHYDKISSSLASLAARHADIVTVCDMGSGEGHHTVNIVRTLHGITGGHVIGIGADASKYGAECASKRSKSLGLMASYGIGADFCGEAEAYFVPANIFSLPIKSASVDCAVSMFAPIPWDEVRRILREGGILAVVSSGREHLIEMRKIIYDDVRDADFTPECADGFSLLDQSSLTYTAHLSSEKEIRDLFTMTPFYYRTTEEGRARLYSHSSLDVTVDVNYTFFVKR